MSEQTETEKSRSQLLRHSYIPSRLSLGQKNSLDKVKFSWFPYKTRMFSLLFSNALKYLSEFENKSLIFMFFVLYIDIIFAFQYLGVYNLHYN